MHRPTGHDDSQAPASAMRSRRPSTVLEMFWSTEPTWISVLVGATQLHTFPLGQKRHDGGSQREISVVIRVIGDHHAASGSYNA
jgi:hypothetical protein